MNYEHLTVEERKQALEELKSIQTPEEALQLAAKYNVELDDDELEQINGGFTMAACALIGIGYGTTACVGAGDSKDFQKRSDVYDTGYGMSATACWGLGVGYGASGSSD